MICLSHRTELVYGTCTRLTTSVSVGSPHFISGIFMIALYLEATLSSSVSDRQRNRCL
ncbi:uncharacterized protein BDW70DRAFT_135492 [Aspergillus foveolatus]|uniref:uncharacterized protein n=1 Tax=Aspergillus foveolatus TaxID=210207 RepID=UPI003CCC9067